MRTDEQGGVPDEVRGHADVQQCPQRVFRGPQIPPHLAGGQFVFGL